MIRLLSSKHFQGHSISLTDCQLTANDNTSPNPDKPPNVKQWICGHGFKADSIGSLYLSDNSFTGENIYILAGFICLCPHLKSLTCYSCEITSNDLKKLLLELSEQNVSLLNVESWDLSKNRIGNKGVSTLASISKVNKN